MCVSESCVSLYADWSARLSADVCNRKNVNTIIDSIIKLMLKWNDWDFRAKISRLFPKFYSESFAVHFTAVHCYHGNYEINKATFAALNNFIY